MKFSITLILAAVSSSFVVGRPATARDATCLRQADFAQGTLIITEPGNYKLCEDIVFHPNPPPDGKLPREGSFDPVFPGPYDENAFGLGFFSAICIAASDVTLYLNGKTIEQSAAHSLWQRFFAIIELADAPFIESTGPAQFVGEGHSFTAASNVKIIGPGILGRSAHHGIHGNNNNNVQIQFVQFKDFEVAAVSLNNVDKLAIEHCTVFKNRQDVPVVGLFSAARFILPYGKALRDMGYKRFRMMIRGKMTTAEEVYNNLVTAVNNVYSDVILGNGIIDKVAHPDEYELFHNPFLSIDGPCYAFLVHGKGPAVGGQGFEFNDEDANTTSSDITIRNNYINKIMCWTNEVPAVIGDASGLDEAVANDPRGAVFQFVNTFDSSIPYISINPDGTYKGNVVADMQMMVAHAIHLGYLWDEPLLQTGANTINPKQVAWAMDGTTVYEPLYRCNGDAMHHVNKGIVVIRVEDTKGFTISNNQIRNVTNLSVAPFTNCYDYHPGASEEDSDEQQGGNIRGISVAAVRGYNSNVPSIVSSNVITDFESAHADIMVGIDVQGDSKSVTIEGNTVDLKAGIKIDPSDKYLALRCREHTGTTGDEAIKVENNNNFEQEMLILNVRRLRTTEHLEGHKSGDIEWKNGGCPFARDVGKFRREL